MTPPESSNEATPQTRQVAQVQGIVGIGAPAGALHALDSFLAHAPVTSGFAFVVVQHLDPQNEEGILAQLLAQHTIMPVTQVVEDTVVEANQVYVIGPNRLTTLHNGMLCLSQPPTAYETTLPIDHFFRAMAKELGDRAIGVMLSGTGNDGSRGLKEIQEHGGMAYVQTPSSSKYVSLPLGAIHEANADRVATPAELGRYVTSDTARASRMDADVGRNFRAVDSAGMQRILGGLLDHTGQDFNGYKKNTIARRIQRRMTVNGIDEIEAYADFVDFNRSELDALFRELLIGVTSFFRDANAFTCLEQKVIEPLFVSHRDRAGPLRIWIPGCSTGEEAYSVAMLFHEHASRHHRRPDFQIFATDLDNSAVEKARVGRYPASIAADVQAERLQKYFIREKDSPTVQVGRQLRDSVVFAVQNVIKDPPFSRLDLICCRNLMIYFGVELQQMLLPILHYALNPGGYLFLGNSETLGVTQQQFRIVDQQWKVFQRQGSTFDTAPVMQRRTKATPVPSSLAHTQQPPQRAANLREITEQALLAEHPATAIVVNDKGDMLYVFGRTGKYLEQSTGEVTTNILRVARDGLRMRLATALHSVHVHQKPYQADGICIRNGDEVVYVRLSVAPITKPVPAQGLALVTLTEVPRPSLPDTTQDAAASAIGHDARLEELERELTATRDYLHTTIEQLEVANVGLSSANDDLQSSNEEMQSANEELQTSKEELQSINEELITLNGELQTKINDLTNINNDIKNLLDNTQVGVIFLDTKLCIRRFTPAIAHIVNLIASDIGRPLEQFVCRLHYDRLFADARGVLETQQSVETEVQGTDGRWYLARILPYRTIDDKADGVVLTFTDVTPLKDSKEKLEFLFNVLPVGISMIDNDRTSFKHNAAFLAMSDLSDDEYASRRHFDRDYLRPDGTSRKVEEFAVSRVLAGSLPC